ncbi:MAG: hypothetical protein V3V45_07255 [Candidatus Brocadiales bacterium]
MADRRIPEELMTIKHFNRTLSECGYYGIGLLKMAKCAGNVSAFLKKNDGMSLVVITAILAILVAVGAVFTSMMGRWQTSATITIASEKALYLAELYAQLGLVYLKDGVVYNGTTSCQTSTTIADISSTEKGAYGVCGPDVTGVPDLFRIKAIGVVGVGLSPPYTWWDQSSCDFIVPAADLLKVRAMRKIEVDAYKTGSSIDIPAKTYVEGTITGNPDFEISDQLGNSVTYDSVGNVIEGSPTGLVSDTVPVDADTLFGVLKEMAICQNDACGNHYYPSPGTGVSWGPSENGWPCDENNTTGTFYYHDDADDTKDIPNVIYVNGDFTLSGNSTVNGIFAMEGDDFDLGGMGTLNGIIVFRSDGTLKGGGAPSTTEAAGVIAYGSLSGSGTNTDVQLVTPYYDSLDNIATSEIAIASWKEEISS